MTGQFLLGELSGHWKWKHCQSVSTGPLDHDEITFISPGYKRLTGTPLGAKTSKLGVISHGKVAVVRWGGGQSVEVWPYYRFIIGSNLITCKCNDMCNFCLWKLMLYTDNGQCINAKFYLSCFLFTVNHFERGRH